MATFYIDPSLSTNGDGSLATPYNTWVGVTLTANNIYRQKRGTIYKGASVRPQNQNSAKATPLTIEAYYNSDGSDDVTKPKPIIDHNGGTNGVGSVMVDTCSNVLVRNVACRNSNGSLGGLKVRRSQFVTFYQCESTLSEFGIIIEQDQASGTSTTTDITVDSCILYNNTGSGICLRTGAASTAILRRIRLKNNLVFNNGTGKYSSPNGGTIVCGGINCYTVFKSTGTSPDVNYQSYDIQVLNNVVHSNNGYGINIEAFGSEIWGSKISNNIVYNNGKSLDVDTHSIWVGNCYDVLVSGNEVYSNQARANFTNGSGIGIFIDYNGSSSTGGARNRVIGNRIYDQYKGITKVQNGSAGIHVLYNDSTIVQGNVIIGCRNGISIGPTGTPNTLVYNNTIIDVLQMGILNQSGCTGTIVKNNIISRALVGLFNHTTGTSGFAETNNNFHSCGINYATGTLTSYSSASINASDTTLNPQFVSEYIPTNSSLTSAGTFLGGRDVFQKAFKQIPSVGAVQYSTDYPVLSTRGVGQ